MNKIKLFALCLGASCSLNINAQVLVNPSFEVPTLTTGGWRYHPDFGIWKYSPRAGVANGNSSWGRGAVDGSQYAFLQMNSFIEQTITQLVPGKLYAGTFWAMRRNGGIGGDAGMPIKVNVDEIPVFPLTLYDQPTWKKYGMWPFQALADSHVLKFTTMPELEDRSELIDDVRLFQVTPAPIASLVAKSGLFAGGSPEDVVHSDDVYWNLRPEPGGDTQNEPIKVSCVFTASGTPNYLCLSIESAVSASSINQVVKVYNTRTAVWDTVADSSLVSSDTLNRSVVIDNPADYVDTSTNTVRCEVSLKKKATLPSNLWRYRIDQIQLVTAP